MSRTIQRSLGIAIAAILGSAASNAQDSRAAPGLEEVLVTAQKREEKLQDVPIAITVIGETQLANQHVYTINDLARTAPALEMIQAFGGPGGGGQIRGIGTQSFSRTAEGAVGIVVDGVPQGNVNVSNIFDMQQVEVLRGPQGTLFGLTSSAGVINMVTVAPKPGEFEGKVQIDYSDKGTASSKFGQQTVRGVVNLPLSGSSALRISATGDKTTGVQYNEVTDEDYVSKDYSVRARYRFMSSDSFEANLIADYSKRTQDYAEPQFTYVFANAGLTTRLAACGITPSFQNQSRCPANPTADERKNYGASLQLDVGLGDLTLTSITGYRKNDTGPTSSDIKGLASESTQIFTDGATNSAYQFSQELRIANPSGQKVEYVAGLFYSDSQNKGGTEPGGAFRVRISTPGGIIPAVTSAQFTETSNESFAAFGQMTYNVTDSLGLIAGIRFTQQEITDSASGNIYAPPAPVSTSADEDNVSGKLGLQYKFGPDLTSYATAARGYKGPQISPASPGNPVGVYIGPEIPTSFEVGIKGSALEGLLGFDANVFYTDVEDYQAQRYGLNSQGILAAVPESIPSVVTKGVEFSVYGQPLAGLALNAGFIYNIAEYPTGWTGYNPNDLRDPVLTDPNSTVGRTNLSEAQIVGVPETKFNFSADYSFSLGAVRAFLGADTVYKSDLRLGPTADERFVFPAGWNTGARLGIRSENDTWSVTIFGRNISDRNEPVTLFGGPSFTPPAPGPGSDPAQPNGYVNGVSGWVTAASLRQVGLTLDLKF